MTNTLNSAEDIRRYAVEFLDADEDQVTVLEDGVEVKVKLRGVGPMEANDLKHNLRGLTHSTPSVDVQVLMPGGDSEDPPNLKETLEEIDMSAEDFVDEILLTDETDGRPGAAIPDPGEFGSIATDHNFTVDVNIDEGDLSDSISDVGEAMKEVAENTHFIRPTPDGQWSESNGGETMDSGQRVKVMYTDGSWGDGTVEEVLDRNCGEYSINIEGNAVTIEKYWRDSPVDIDASERVIKVYLDGASKNFDFPESVVLPKVGDIENVGGVGKGKAEALRNCGFPSMTDLYVADQEVLAEVQGIGNALAARIKADLQDFDPKEYADGWIEEDTVNYTCPCCGKEFTDSHAKAVEGFEDGKMYCSINCLNKSEP